MAVTIEKIIGFVNRVISGINYSFIISLTKSHCRVSYCSFIPTGYCLNWMAMLKIVFLFPANTQTRRGHTFPLPNQS